MIEKLTISVTTIADGSATAYSAPFTGKIEHVQYVKNNFDNGVDFTITLENTGEGVWAESNVDASATRAPRRATHATDGSASLYAAAGEPVEDKIAAANDRLKIVIASGGNVKAGTFHLFIDGTAFRS